MLKAKRFKTSDKDIFEAFEDGDFNILINVMNRKHNFQHGFSRQLANRFPEVVARDLAYENVKGSVDGVNVSDANTTGKMVINLYCIRNKRDENGSLINLNQLAASLSTLNRILSKKDKVGFVKIGTGISKGDWDEISEVINDNLKRKGILFGQE